MPYTWGLKIIFGWRQDITTSHGKFCLVKSHFWPVKNIGKKVNWSLCNFLFMDVIIDTKSKIYRWGISYLFKNESVCDRSTWLASEVLGWLSCLSGQTLSIEWPLFWALHMQFWIICSWTSRSNYLLSIPISFNLLSSILISLRSAASRW